MTKWLQERKDHDHVCSKTSPNYGPFIQETCLNLFIIQILDAATTRGLTPQIP
jgi:hypothetical protein